jgi:hypothetical protein
MRAVSTYCVSASLIHTFIRARAPAQSLQKPTQHGCDSTHLETTVVGAIQRVSCQLLVVEPNVAQAERRHLSH